MFGEVMSTPLQAGPLYTYPLQQSQTWCYHWWIGYKLGGIQNFIIFMIEWLSKYKKNVI